jgi:hypothetical protein
MKPTMQNPVASVFCACLISINCVSLCAAHESEGDFVRTWDYPHDSAGGVGKSTGPVSFSRSTRRTTDSVEKVVLWYASRVGLPADHTLVTNAKQGFSGLNVRLDIRTNTGHDTDEKQDHLSVLGTITRTHAHVTMFYQPSRGRESDVLISISQSTVGTNIHVFRQEPGQ